MFFLHQTRVIPLSPGWMSEEEWHSLATFANIARGSTANLEGEPSTLPYGYAAL